MSESSTNHGQRYYCMMIASTLIMCDRMTFPQSASDVPASVLNLLVESIDTAQSLSTVNDSSISHSEDPDEFRIGG
jgi:hypothetical protein